MVLSGLIGSLGLQRGKIGSQLSAALDMFQKILVRDNADYNSYIRRVNALSAVEKCWEANNGTRTALYSALLEFFGHAMKSIHHGAGVEPM